MAEIEMERKPRSNVWVWVAAAVLVVVLAVGAWFLFARASRIAMHRHGPIRPRCSRATRPSPVGRGRRASAWARGIRARRARRSWSRWPAAGRGLRVVAQREGGAGGGRGRVAGRRPRLATMKHVGVNVAADPLFSVAYMGVNGGLVVVSADDPGHAFVAERAGQPPLRPSRPHPAPGARHAGGSAAVHGRAFALSEEFDTPVLLRTTTRLSHGTARVRVGERDETALRPYRKSRARTWCCRPRARAAPSHRGGAHPGLDGGGGALGGGGRGIGG
jgi:hypothetical protein